MRHSDPKLTANTYTDPSLLDVAGAVESLPRFDQGGAQEQRATGTEGRLAPDLPPDFATERTEAHAGAPGRPHSAAGTAPHRLSLPRNAASAPPERLRKAQVAGSSPAGGFGARHHA